jgi:predicted metal-dependent HD superfamily phosphohydrolase
LQLAILTEQEDLITQIKGDPVIASIHLRLASSLDPSLTYHSKEHSDDVTEMAIALGATDQLDEHSLLLLGIAAAYHDAGFIEHRTEHEIISADLAEYAMKSDGRFSQNDIELIRRMILDTKLQPDGPSHAISSRLSAWLVDADLANLGRSNFLEQTRLLANELNIPMSLMLNESLALMNRHQWHSRAGEMTLGKQKDLNKATVLSMIESTC